MKKITLYILIFGIFFSQDNSGFSLLTHSLSAKRLAQASASGAFDSFIPGEYNPAFLTDITETSFTINKQSWIDDVSFIGANTNFKFG